MSKYLGDILVIVGCALILVGVYRLWPMVTWFVAGFMLIAAGVLVEASKESK